MQIRDHQLDKSNPAAATPNKGRTLLLLLLLLMSVREHAKTRKDKKNPMETFTHKLIVLWGKEKREKEKKGNKPKMLNVLKTEKIKQTKKDQS